MESEYSKSSSEETDRSEQAKDDRRSYECVFCKRGFTTAQALGGHMNIHRKDRAKTCKPNKISTKLDHNHQSYQQPHEVQSKYQSLFPEMSWGLRSHLTNDHHHYLNLFPSTICDNNMSKREDEDEDEDELDLELRLGYYP